MPSVLAPFFSLKPSRFNFVAFILAFAVSAGAQTVELLPTSPGGKLIQSLIEAGRIEELRWPDVSDYRKHLRNYYAPNGYAFAWSREGVITPQARTVVRLFEEADRKGVNSADYDGPRWQKRIEELEKRSDELAFARFDVAMTATLMRYVSDLHIGRINPRNVRFDLDVEGKKYYLPSVVAEVKSAGAPAWVLSEIEPRHAEYRRLQAALAHYRRISDETAAEKSRFEARELREGEQGTAVESLARILARYGDMPSSTLLPNSFDSAVLAGLKRFQSRHGLPSTGKLDAKTAAALNVPAAQRVRQIQWALERWRWAPAEFASPPIIVNIPEFVLRGLDSEGRAGISMRVVVGQAYSHQTPVFEDQMKYVVFRPYWNVPPRIQRNEIVPKVEKDRAFLAANDYEVVDGNGTPVGGPVTDAVLTRLRAGQWRIRQKPGPSNALGLVKFIFPNENNVYFHSTPAQALFSRARRDFSHGCIRVEDPVALAAWVLRDQPEWTPPSIRAAMDGTETRTVLLKAPIPILIIYATAAVDEDGAVRFFDDIYGHDAVLEEALAAGYPYPG